MTKVTIILFLIFLVVVYVYTFLKLKKSKEKTKQINTIQKFHDNYKHLTGTVSPTENMKNDKNTNYTKYVTKYNSTEDYREKN